MAPRRTPRALLLLSAVDHQARRYQNTPPGSPSTRVEAGCGAGTCQVSAIPPPRLSHHGMQLLPGTQVCRQASCDGACTELPGPLPTYDAHGFERGGRRPACWTKPNYTVLLPGGQTVQLQASPDSLSLTPEQCKYLAKHCVVCKQFMPDPTSLKQHIRRKQPEIQIEEAKIHPQCSR